MATSHPAASHAATSHPAPSLTATSLAATAHPAAAPSRTIAETVERGARALQRGSASPRLDAELLLARVLGLPRSGLITRAREPLARADEPLAEERARTFDALLERRLQGVPVAYLTGTREFWSLALRVTPDVLVPRPETELVVELALQRIPRAGTSSVLDLGTGSGAVALAIASERPEARITAVDICPRALQVARQNSRDLGLAHIDWRVGSWFAAVPGERFDLIVANPPYVAAGDPALPALAAEPRIALSPGPTGLEALSAIAAAAPAHLQKGGWLMLEHGSEQAPAVAQLLAQHGFTGVRSHLDFSGKPRVTRGAVHSPHQEPT